MLKPLHIAALAPLALSACMEGGTYSDASPGPGYVTLSEAVIARAAPYQDLSAVRIDPADGCYVYRYVGPVETTFLPLRTVDGRPICTRAPDAPATS